MPKYYKPKFFKMQCKTLTLNNYFLNNKIINLIKQTNTIQTPTDLYFKTNSYYCYYKYAFFNYFNIPKTRIKLKVIKQHKHSLKFLKNQQTNPLLLKLKKKKNLNNLLFKLMLKYHYNDISKKIGKRSVKLYFFSTHKYRQLASQKTYFKFWIIQPLLKLNYRKKIFLNMLKPSLIKKKNTFNYFKQNIIPNNLITYKHKQKKTPQYSVLFLSNSLFLNNFFNSYIFFKYTDINFFNSYKINRFYNKTQFFFKPFIVGKQNILTKSNLYYYNYNKLHLYKLVKSVEMSFYTVTDTQILSLISFVNTLEIITGRKVITTFNPFLEKSLSFVELMRCYTWNKNLVYFKKIIGHHLFIIESLKIIYISIKIKDPIFLINWVKKMLARVSFFKFKTFIRYIGYIVRFYLLKYFTVLNFKGVKIRLKGKVGVSGNARTRTIYQFIGKTGQSTLNRRILTTTQVIWTFTGAIGLRIWFYF